MTADRPIMPPSPLPLSSPLASPSPLPLPSPSHAPGADRLASPSGILVIDKHLGPTSMDICRMVKRRLMAGGAGKKVKVGHGGTLDPLATGILVVLIGRCTKLCDAVMADQKVYLTNVDLSAFSTTDDAEGERTEVTPAQIPTVEQVRAASARFIGQVQQTPPIYSAIKIDGQEAYKLARKGKAEGIVMAPRTVRIDSIDVHSYAWPHAILEVTCGKGVYIRSLARDLGVALGTGGTLAALRRVRIGSFDLTSARTIASLGDRLAESDLTAPSPELFSR